MTDSLVYPKGQLLIIKTVSKAFSEPTITFALFSQLSYSTNANILNVRRQSACFPQFKWLHCLSGFGISKKKRDSRIVVGMFPLLFHLVNLVLDLD